jgi:deoxyribodipyrimidine photolyase
MTSQVVWFKRDMRVVENAPLAEAAAARPVPPLVIVEPDRREPDTKDETAAPAPCTYPVACFCIIPSAQ